MLGHPPQLWGYLTRRWCPVPPVLAGLWWGALVKARWSAAAAWREALLAYDREDRVVSTDLVEAFLAEVASPQQLIKVLGELMREKRLLPRDAHALEEEVLRHVDHAGQWKNHPRRRTA